ncbi:MAG TPA: hypothetical protein VEA78_08965 [Acidimicrobiales bacterium]|nr:hypothetical protein [Acidimicrobiales bacterium]
MKRILAALVIGAAVSGGVFASATTLGGLNGQSLGANNATVTACDTNGVTSAYTTTYSSTSKKYDATGVTVGDIAAACVGKTLKFSLVNTAGTSLYEGTKTVAGTSEAFTVPAGTPAENVDNIAVTIFG